MTTLSKVRFIDNELENAFNNLSEEDPIKKALVKAIQNMNLLRILK